MRLARHQDSRSSLLAIAVMLAVTSARASDDGSRCTTSADCGDLRCIDEQCRDIKTIRLSNSRRAWTIGDSAMFGSQIGYGKTILVADVSALASASAVLALTAVTNDRTWAFASVPLVSLAGPIVHAIHGRALPAIISFFAWGSLCATSGLSAPFIGLAMSNDTTGPTTYTVGAIIAVVGGALLTWLDVYMAREVRSTTLADHSSSR